MVGTGGPRSTMAGTARGHGWALGGHGGRGSAGALPPGLPGCHGALQRCWLASHATWGRPCAFQFERQSRGKSVRCGCPEPVASWTRRECPVHPFQQAGATPTGSDVPGQVVPRAASPLPPSHGCSVKCLYRRDPCETHRGDDSPCHCRCSAAADVLLATWCPGHDH